MNEHNGWKNETTWTINVFYMETIEKMLEQGCSHETIVEHIKRELNQDLYLEQRNLIGCALKLVDWDTLFTRAIVNITKVA
jgi:predicted N-acyltransferase